MSFGPWKPIGPQRTTRPAVAKKVVSKAPIRSDAKKNQQTAKPKPAPAVVTPKKPTPAVAPKLNIPRPTTPDPAYDYESDFESDESVPSAEGSSSESHVGNNTATDSENSSSEGGDDERDGNDEDDANVEDKVARILEGHANQATVLQESSHREDAKCKHQKEMSNPRSVRSVDILSKISLNDVTVELYKFDPEDYVELRTHFGVTTVSAHAKHIQTDSGLVSTAQQTSGIMKRDRHTSMQGDFRSSIAENDYDENCHMDNRMEDEDEVQNSSLQNIERMFSTLNGALERQFSRVSSLRRGIAATPNRKNYNPQRIILQLVRKSAPIFEALLEAKLLKAHKRNAEVNGKYEHPLHASYRRTMSTSSVIRSFDTGKMCPEYEVKLLHAKNIDQQSQTDHFVLEFWANAIYSRPVYRFSSWSSLKCVDYECRKQMMVFGGTDDGILQLWLGDGDRCYNEILAPHQIVAPQVGRKHQLSCWEMVAVKVLPAPVTRDNTIETSNDNVLNQVFGLFSTGIIIVWHVQIDIKSNSSLMNNLTAKLGRPDVSLVQSKVIDLSTRIGDRLPCDALRSFGYLLLHDHHQMIVTSDRSVIRLSHFVETDYDPVLLIQPDPTYSIMNLKRMALTNDTLFVLYSNKTVCVLKLSTPSDDSDNARNRHRKHDSQPNLMLSVCTNKSCTIQSIVHDEAKRYGNNSVSGSRADGGTVAQKQTEIEKTGGEMLIRPRFHHGQLILFFGSCNPDNLLSNKNFDEKFVVFQRT